MFVGVAVGVLVGVFVGVSVGVFVGVCVAVAAKVRVLVGVRVLRHGNRQLITGVLKGGLPAGAHVGHVQVQPAGA